MKSDPPVTSLAVTAHRFAREEKHINYGLVYMNECVWKIREMKLKDPRTRKERLMPRTDLLETPKSYLISCYVSLRPGVSYRRSHKSARFVPCALI